MHNWGDEWFQKNGRDLDAAIEYIMLGWKKYGRIGSWGKEKYGTFRDHPKFFDGTLQSLIWPGYAYLQGNKWFYWNIDYPIIRRIGIYTGIAKLVQLYQAKVYNYFIQKAIQKYPNLIDELVSSLEGYEMVKPGWFGKVDGTAIHKRYWREV